MAMPENKKKTSEIFNLNPKIFTTIFYHIFFTIKVYQVRTENAISNKDII